MVIIAYEGKSDGEFFDSLLEAYNLPPVVYYDFKGKDYEKDSYSRCKRFCCGASKRSV